MWTLLQLTMFFVFVMLQVASAQNECGTTSFTDGQTGIVTSPHFPLTYPHRLNCVYSIDVDRKKTVSLGFLSFSLERTYSPMQSCDYDWLTISCLFDGLARGNPNQNRKYCGEIRMPMTLNYSNCDSLTLNFVTDATVSHGGFQLRYTITAAGYTEPNTTDEGCGNTSFTGPTGFISSPRFPLSYPNSLGCVYSIDVDRNKMVVLGFLSFNIEGTSHSSLLDRCNFDWLMISCLSNGSASEFSQRNRKYCGEKEDPLMLGYSNCDSMTLNFVTDYSVTSGGFQLRYRITSADQSDCGDTLFSGPNGAVTSPNYPFPYPHNMSCTYSIDVGRNNSVLLKFTKFNLENPDSAGYCTDWLMITCNGTKKVNPNNNKKFCGAIRWTSSMLFVDCPSLVLEFFAGSSNDNEGFVIEYTVVENSSSTDDNSELDCGATLFTNSPGFVSLPKNSRNYLATVNCTYTISAIQTSYIWLDIYLSPSIQSLNSFHECERESLTIGCVSEGETELNPNTTRVFCRHWSSHSRSSQLVFADCRTLKLSIRSTIYNYRETFRIPFSVYGPSEMCGNTSFSAPYGVISSRQLPWNHPKSLNCLYTIYYSGHVNSVGVILDRLSFGYSNIRNASCYGSSLTITCLVNGTSVPHPYAGRQLCGTMNNATTARFPACHRVLLNYSRDSIISSDTGFSVRYRMGDYDPECGNTFFNEPSGFITSPGYPVPCPSNLNCFYSIIGGQSHAISLSFLDLKLYEIPYSVDSCARDWLTVSCLSDKSAAANISSSRKYCGLKTTQLQFAFPRCEVLVLNFQRDPYITGGGFKVSYTVIDKDAECGNISFNGPNGIINSPKFPLSYPHDLNCSYFITGGQRNTISLSFLSFSLEGISSTTSLDNCHKDWLTVSCLSDQSATENISSSRRYCGVKTTPLRFTFPSCEVVVLNFGSDSSVTGGGFRVRYAVIDTDLLCGVPVHGPPSGVISFQRNYTNFGDSFDCNYVINATQPSSISLTIWSLILQSSVGRNCQSDWLLITCINGQTALDHKVSHRTCDNLNASTQFTFPSCAAAKVVYHRDSESAGKTFRIEYTVNGLVTVKTELPTTSAFTTTEILKTRSSCATGCEISSDATYCECITTPSSTTQFHTKSVTSVRATSDTIQSETTAITSDVPVTVRTTLDVIQPVTTTILADVPITVRTTSDRPTIQSETTAITSDVPTTVRATSDTIQSATTAITSDMPTTVRTTLGVIQPVTTTVTSDVPTTVRATSGTIQTETTTFRFNVPIGQTTKCDIRCSELSGDDRTTCNCRSTKSGDKVPATELPTTSLSPTAPVTAKTTCATGCKPNPDATYCECLRDTSQTAAISVSMEIPVTGSEKCDFGCEMSADGTTCDCSTTHSGDLVVNTQMGLSVKRGSAVGISLTVILVVTGAICLGAFLLFRRHRKKIRSEMLVEETHELELEDDTSKRGSLFRGFRNQNQDTSRYLPLRPMSISDHVESSSSHNSLTIDNEIQPSL